MEADEYDITCFTPEPGWRIEWTTEDGINWTDPVTGWCVRGGGIYPVATDSSGITMVLAPGERILTEYRIYHPDGTWPSDEDFPEKNGKWRIPPARV